MTDADDNVNPLQAIHGHETDEDEEADEVFSPRQLDYGAGAVPEGVQPEESVEQTTAESDKTERKKKMTHYSDQIKAGNVIFIHLDLETGGERVGIIQLSAIAHDSGTNQQVGATFNEYVQPSARAKADDWNPYAMEITGLGPNDSRIKSAAPMETVWPKWRAWCHELVPVGKVGCLVAWNGKGSDCKWLFKYTEEATRNSFQMPQRIEFFMDPMNVIKTHKGCKLNEQHTGVLGYGLEVIYCYVTGETSLDGAHNSLFDTLAQFKVCKHKSFKSHWNMATSVVPLEEVWKANREQFLAQEAEINRPVPAGWVLGLPSRRKLIDPLKEFNSGEGGGVAGPEALLLDHGWCCTFYLSSGL